MVYALWVQKTGPITGPYIDREEVFDDVAQALEMADELHMEQSDIIPLGISKFDYHTGTTFTEYDRLQIAAYLRKQDAHRANIRELVS